MVMCENVKVPWERVFVHMDAVLAREIYIKTPGHCYGNHQSNVRFHAKMQLIVGLASKIAQASGANEVPAVREVLGRFAALEAALGGMIAGQIQDAEDWPAGYKTFNRRYMYAALNWCTESHSQIIDALRELCGGGIFQMPADVTVMHDPKLRQMFETYWQTPQLGALERMKLYKLAWDLIGSEFAGRHLQYEKFYAGASFIVRNHSFREAPWEGLPQGRRRLDGHLRRSSPLSCWFQRRRTRDSATKTSAVPASTVSVTASPSSSQPQNTPSTGTASPTVSVRDGPMSRMSVKNGR